MLKNIFGNKLLLFFCAITVGVLSPPKTLAQSCCPDGNSTISTIAGTGATGYSGDGGPALSATFNWINDVLVDPAGNMYATDFYNNVIRRIDPSGIITTYAGTGVQGYSGDGGPAASAQLYYPAFLVRDAAGNLYFTDSGNRVIRRITPGGTISTFAGSGAFGYTGDGGPAALATFGTPWGMAMDPSGNIYVADMVDHVVRKITPGGIISTYAGNGTPGFSGDGGPATLAQMWACEGVAWDGGYLYIWDDLNYRIRRVDPSGTITTFAGTGVGGISGDGGPALNAAFTDAEGLGACGGNIYVSDWGADDVRMIDACGIIHHVVGSGAAPDSGDGGPAAAAGTNGPRGMFFDPSGNMYFGESFGMSIRKLTRDCSPTPTLTCLLPPTFTPTATFTSTPTPTPSNSPTNTPTRTPTFSPTNSPTPTMTPSPTPTFTPTCETHVWPDPFDPNYALDQSLKVDCLPVGSTVSFYTLTGERVATLGAVDGWVEWKGRNQSGARVSSGIYYYVIQNGNKVLGTGKFLVTNNH